MTESETTELKKSLADLKQGLVSLAAMLNKHGEGELWFGIAPDGSAAGLDLNEKTLRDVSQAIASHIEPRIYPEVTQQTVDGKHCLRIRATGQHKPYFAYGRAYIRVADEDRQMSARELENLVLRHNREALRWDNEASRVEPSSLKESKIRRFVETAGLPWDNARNALDKLGLLKDGRLLNAAQLFFADAPIELRCAVFATHTSATIIDRHDFHGDILELIDEAQKYILKNIHIGMRLQGMRRVDVPEVSPEALREAIINAFCHRDWRDPDYVHVAIFKDRVEIRNPGGLHDDLTLEDLRRGNVSRRRNPLIADLLRRIHLVEAWGRGMPLIHENAPDVAFREVAGLFIASFARPSAAQSRAEETTAFMPSGTNQKTGLKNGLKTTLKTSSKPEQEAEPEAGRPPAQTRKENPEKHQEMLIKHLLQWPKASSAELSVVTGLSTNGVKYHLNQLKLRGKLRRHGPRKGGHWEVIPDAED